MIRTVGILIVLAIFSTLQSSYADEWKVKFEISGMDSPTIGKQVKTFIRDLYGIDEVELDLPGESVIVTFESSDIDLDTLKDKIVSSGFDITRTIPLKEG